MYEGTKAFFASGWLSGHGASGVQVADQTSPPLSLKWRFPVVGMFIMLWWMTPSDMVSTTGVKLFWYIRWLMEHLGIHRYSIIL